MQTEALHIQLSQDKKNIVTVQFNSTKRNVRQPGAARTINGELGQSALTDLVKDFENAVPVDKKVGAVREKDQLYTVVIFIYRDGSKDRFKIFKNRKKWYIETDDGKIYINENTKYFEDHIHIDEIKPADSSDTEPVIELGTDPEFIRRRLKVEMLNGSYDVCAEFTIWTENLIKNYNGLFPDITEEDVIEQVREKMAAELKISQYAQQHGFDVTDEEVTEAIEWIAAGIEKSDTYSDYEKIYEEAGTTLRESLERNREYLRRQWILKKFYEAIYQEYRHGNDKIGDVVYNTLSEFRNAYIKGVVESGLDSSEAADIERELDEAEDYYDRYSGGKTSMEYNDSP